MEIRAGGDPVGVSDCRFETREDPPGLGNYVAWCLTHLCAHDNTGADNLPDGYFFHDPVAAARNTLELLHMAEAQGMLLLNREGQRELIAVLSRVLALADELAKIRTDAERMIAEGCTSPSPEAFAYLAQLRDRHVAQIANLERRVAMQRREFAKWLARPGHRD